MNMVPVSTPFNIHLDFEIAAIHRRILAWFLDVTILVMYAYGMQYIIASTQISGNTYPVGIYILLISLPLLFYPLFMEIIYQGQSVGKMATGIRVLSLTGGEPQLGQYILRWVFRLWEWPLVFGILTINELGLIVQLLSCCFIGVVVIITIAVSSKHQRFGDMAAGTAVVDTKKQFSIQDTVFQHINTEGYKVVFPDVMKLSDRDINAIKAVLTQTRQTGRFETAHRISDRVKEVLQISSRLEVLDFLEKLLDDYNFLATKNE